MDGSGVQGLGSMTAFLRNYARMSFVLRALSNLVYRRLFAAQVIALAGTGLATVALGLMAYDLDPAHAAGVLGTALAIKMVAYVFVAPVATAALARLSRRSVMIAADLLRLVVALALPFVGQVWQVYVLVFVLQAASATFTPTFQSVVPDALTDEEDYTAALSLSRLAYDLESVLSPMLAAALLLLVPASDLFFGTAVGFAGSALLVASTVLPPKAVRHDAGPGQGGPFGRRVRHGFVLFVRTPALRPVLALNLAVASVGAFVIVQTVVIVRTVFGQDEGMVAVLLAANGAGSMTAAILLPRLLRRWPERPLMLGGAALLILAGLVVTFVLAVPGTAGLVGVGVLWLLVGLGWSAVETPVGRIFRRSVPAADLADVFAAQFSLSHACWLLTYPLAGWLGGVGLSATALVLAAVAGSATLVAARVWPPAARAGAVVGPVEA